MIGERLQVQHDGREVELVARASEAPQAHALEAMWVFRCAKRISTLFLSSRDFANSSVRMMARVMSRASSFTARGTLRQGMFGQHFGFSGQGPQSGAYRRSREAPWRSRKSRAASSRARYRRPAARKIRELLGALERE